MLQSATRIFLASLLLTAPMIAQELTRAMNELCSKTTA